MSAYPPRADMRIVDIDVCYVPKADISGHYHLDVVWLSDGAVEGLTVTGHAGGAATPLPLQCLRAH
jgi:hypothetical protein